MGNTFGFQLAKCFRSQSEQLLDSIAVDAQKFILYGYAKITILLKLAHSSVSTFRHPFDIKEKPSNSDLFEGQYREKFDLFLNVYPQHEMLYLAYSWC